MRRRSRRPAASRAVRRLLTSMRDALPKGAPEGIQELMATVEVQVARNGAGQRLGWGEKLRIISARRATRRERKTYERRQESD